MNIVDVEATELAELAHRFGVARLDLFGSGAGEHFDPSHSDLYFLVTFQDTPPGGMANAYFGLLEGLERLFERPVDLVTERSIKNPYFLRSVNQTRRPVYVA